MNPLSGYLHIPRIKRREEQRAVNSADAVIHLLTSDGNIVEKESQIQSLVQCRRIDRIQKLSLIFLCDFIDKFWKGNPISTRIHFVDPSGRQSSLVNFWAELTMYHAMHRAMPLNTTWWALTCYSPTNAMGRAETHRVIQKVPWPFPWQPLTIVHHQVGEQIENPCPTGFFFFSRQLCCFFLFWFHQFSSKQKKRPRTETVGNTYTQYKTHAGKGK